MSITEKERHVLEHACAWRHERQFYRNHYCAGPDHEDWRMLQALCERGLMRVAQGPGPALGGQSVFAVTATGRLALETT
jgi:hypothetical protein